MKILVLIDRSKEKLNPSSFNVLTAGSKIHPEINALVIGQKNETVINELKGIPHLKNIYSAEHETLVQPLAETYAKIIVEIVKKEGITHVLAPANTYGKNILPRASALLDVGQISDVVEIIDADTFRRPIYAGNALETIRSLDTVKMLTIRTTAFSPMPLNTEQKAEVKALHFEPDVILSRFLSMESVRQDRAELTTAKIVISGGRGLKNKENFARLTAIADEMHAALGATRAAVDANLAPNECQVGQTGKVVAPQLYIAVGLSGAIQHLAGIKDSKIIAAINKDADAPIFKVADYGLVGDIEEILPRWQQWLNENK